MRFTIVLPCYNEEKSVATVLDSLPKEALEIVVVDNNSSDKTSIIATQHGAKVVLEKKQGYGVAIKRGVRASNGEAIVVLDGDGQYPSEKIQEVLSFLEDNQLDFVSCSRFPLVDKSSMPLLRRVGNWLFNLATNLLFSLKLKDSQSGMWVFKKEVFDKIKPQSDGMPFSEELKIRVANDKELKFIEYPINYKPRIGESKLFPFKDGLRNLFYLFRLKLEFWKANLKLDSLIFYAGIFVLLSIYILLSLREITAPFIHITSDVNGQNGIAAVNLLNFGLFKLKFGVIDRLLLDAAAATGQYYTHHPSFFVLPVVFTYKLFGVSELTTRLGPMLMMSSGIVIFTLALRKIFKNIWLPLVIMLFFVLLPGVIFYGKTFELAVFSLPNAMITFSLFIFYQFNKKNIYFYLFLFSIITGGLMGWFFYLMPVSVWFAVLFGRRFIELGRKKILCLVPLLLILVATLNVLHFNNLNKGSSIVPLLDAFSYRATPPPLSVLGPKILSVSILLFTILFLITFLFGLVQFIFKFKKDQLVSFYLLPAIVFPFLVLIVFSEWSRHPFGPLFFSLPIAILTGILIKNSFEKSKKAGATLLIFLVVTGFYLSWRNQNVFYYGLTIIKKEDINLLKELGPQVNDDDVCLGSNDAGIGLNGIVDWYMRKRTLRSPSCLENPDNHVKVGVIFHPQTSSFYLKEQEFFSQHGFNMQGCGKNWCLVTKDPVVKIK